VHFREDCLATADGGSAGAGERGLAEPIGAPVSAQHFPPITADHTAHFSRPGANGSFLGFGSFLNQIFAMVQRSIVKDSSQLVRFRISSPPPSRLSTERNKVSIPPTGNKITLWSGPGPRHHQPISLVPCSGTQFAGPKIAVISEQSRNPSSV